MVGDQVLTNLDPRLSLGPDGVTVRRNCFHTLLEIDSASGEVTPLLAAEMPVQEDDTTWLVTIKSGAKWHDGTPVTADDVKYTADWMLDPANNSIFGSVVLDGVDSVDVVDDTTVRFHLKRVLGSFLERLCERRLPVAEHRIAVGGEDELDVETEQALKRDACALEPGGVLRPRRQAQAARLIAEDRVADDECARRLQPQRHLVATLRRERRDAGDVAADPSAVPPRDVLSVA